MPQDQNGPGQGLAPYSEVESTFIRETVKVFLSQTFQQEMEATKQGLAELQNAVQNAPPGRQVEIGKAVLQSLQAFYRALEVGLGQAEFSVAEKEFQRATAGFANLVLPDAAKLATGLQMYASGIVELHKRNVARALEMLDQVRGHLQDVGYGDDYQKMFDLTESERLYVVAIQAFEQMDLVTANALIERAAHTTETAATKRFYRAEHVGRKSGFIAPSAGCLAFGG